MGLKLYLLKNPRLRVDHASYEYYDAIVVVAASESEARQIHPDDNWNVEHSFEDVWALSLDQVQVTYLGEAAPELTDGIVLKSFNLF